MKIGIVIGNQIDCNYICKKVADLIDSYQRSQGDATKCLLVMELKEPLEHSGDSLLPKIEHKE